MGKKNANPAEAYRKAQRKKEVKKNKAERSKARDLATVKKDTTDLEEAIKELDESKDDSVKLAELKAELERINRKKAEYVAEHPEMRRLVYRRRKADEPEPELPVKKRNYFKKNGLPRHPERSIYYDPVFNPLGVAPPGMPYAERPLLPDEVDSQASSSEDENDEDLPPGATLVKPEDGIVMPDGPPPGQKPSAPAGPPIPTLPPGFVPPLPPGAPPPTMLPPGFSAQQAFPYPPPPGFAGGMPPPPPPIGFPMGMPLPPPGYAPYPPGGFMQAPPGFFPSGQDSLSNVPHQTVHAHRAPRPTPQPSGLPSHPSLPAKPVAAAALAAATVSAAPQLRDLKREATAFVPTAVKRKKVTAESDSNSKLNAAPAVDDTSSGEAVAARPNLLDSLKDQFGAVPVPAAPKSDYDKFMEDMNDIIGPK